MAFGKRVRGRALTGLAVAWLVFGGATESVWAAGPRFVSGSGLWVQPGLPEGWAVSQLQYFTDAGNLGPSVTHAQADAMVAAAAAAWNVASSSLSLAQGGVLAEDVSSANTYFDGNEVVFPADVEAANESAVPVAVIYDADGSVTDLLLGSGASASVECRQNGVIESVDDIQNDGHIHHAVLILNGRCVGSAAEQMTQMQYQLTRAFGRVLGLAWSQTNDNVFTAASPITADEITYWPVMHPLDVICGTYTYQCMTNPFSLRVDDLSALALLYPVTQNNMAAGKQISADDAVVVQGSLNFPSGQGMDWVNVTAHRQHDGSTESWETVSGITGFKYNQASSNPVTQIQPPNIGERYEPSEGFFTMAAVPVNTVSNVFFTSEAINPLYTGAYALGPYVRPPVTPSGSPQTSADWSSPAGEYQANMTSYDAASACTPEDDGTEGAPAAVDGTGWQAGLLCGWGHSSWWSATVRTGHSWTLEVTATDETGAASLNKMQPVVGVWNAADPTGVLPTVASQGVPFNSMSLGMTQLRMDAAAGDSAFRFVVSDQFGAGRPDFTYTARVLYADTVTPASVGASGGTITIAGTGFRAGNVVQVNGVVARVQSWSATRIVAIVPALAGSGAVAGSAVDVAVRDASTGGTTSIQNALTYTSAPDVLQQISAPSALETDVPAAVPWGVRVLASDGVTPLAGAALTISVDAGSAGLGVCGGAENCTALTDSQGMIRTTVTGLSAGAVTVSATDVNGGATLQVRFADTDPLRGLTVSQGDAYVAAGAGGSWTVQMTATLDGVPVPSTGITWAVSPGLNLALTASSTGADGVAGVTVSAANLQPGSVNTVTGCAWTNVCASWTVYGVEASQWQVNVMGGAGQSVGRAGQLGAVTLEVTDSAGHAIEGAPVSVYQRVLAWEGTCATQERCPAAPVLGSSEQNEVSDGTGQITLKPEQLAGIPQVVQVAASTGTEGFVTLTLVKTP